MIAKLIKATSTEGEPNKNFKRLVSKYAIYIVFVAMCIVMTILSPVFLTVANLLNVAVSYTHLTLPTSG